MVAKLYFFALRELHRLRIFEEKVLGKIFGPHGKNRRTGIII
jgi:hypothetical protein